jgi:hypothetical protein
MIFDRRRHGIEPMYIAKEIFHRLCRHHLFDPHRHDGDAFACAAFDLATNL